MRPAAVQTVTEIPKLGSGKISKLANGKLDLKAAKALARDAAA